MGGGVSRHLGFSTNDVRGNRRATTDEGIMLSIQQGVNSTPIIQESAANVVSVAAGHEDLEGQSRSDSESLFVITGPSATRPPPRPDIRLDTSAVTNSNNPTFSPGREDALCSCIAHTPNGEETHVYKYYCPLCMSFYRDILKSSCCGNYTCFPCCMDFLLIRGIKTTSVHEILNEKLLANIPCPNCGTINFTPMLVAPLDEVRDYSFNAIQRNYGRTSSPLRIGDSFEDLKRKMLAYSADKNNNNSSNHGTTTAIKAPHRLPPLTITDSSYIEGIALLGYLNEQLDGSRISETNDHFENSLDLPPIEPSAVNSSRSSIFLNTNSQRMLEAEFDDVNRSRITEGKEENIVDDNSFNENIYKSNNDLPESSSVSSSRLRNLEENDSLFSAIANSESTQIIVTEEKYENNDDVIELNASLPLVMTSLETSDIMSLGSLDLSCNVLDHSCMDISDIVETEGEVGEGEGKEIEFDHHDEEIRSHNNFIDNYKKDIESEEDEEEEEEGKNEVSYYRNEEKVEGKEEEEEEEEEEEDGRSNDIDDPRLVNQYPLEEEKDDIDEAGEVEVIEDTDRSREGAPPDLLMESVLDSDEDDNNDSSILLCNNYIERSTPSSASPPPSTPPLLQLSDPVETYSTSNRSRSRTSSKPSILRNSQHEFKNDDNSIDIDLTTTTTTTDHHHREDSSLPAGAADVRPSRSRSRGHSISTVVVEVKQGYSEDFSEYYSTSLTSTATAAAAAAANAAERVESLTPLTNNIDRYHTTTTTTGTAPRKVTSTSTGNSHSEPSEFDDIRDER